MPIGTETNYLSWERKYFINTIVTSILSIIFIQSVLCNMSNTCNVVSRELEEMYILGLTNMATNFIFWNGDFCFQFCLPGVYIFLRLYNQRYVSLTVLTLHCQLLKLSYFTYHILINCFALGLLNIFCCSFYLSGSLNTNQSLKTSAVFASGNVTMTIA